MSYRGGATAGEPSATPRDDWSLHPSHEEKGGKCARVLSPWS